MAGVWNRINALLLLVVLIALLAVIAMLATGVRGGPLDPISPPAPTDGVKLPGTPISSLPYTISQPGFYYVTRDLNGLPNQNGITIDSSDVTLDLGGFTLRGVANSQNGVLVTGSPRRNIRIENGAVNFWAQGISAGAAVYSRVSGVIVIGSVNLGIEVGGHSEIDGCNVSGTSALNSRAASGVSAAVRNCTITDNANIGINVSGNSLVEGNMVRNNSQGIWLEDALVDDNTVRNNASTKNTNWDIQINGGVGNVIQGNVYCDVNDAGSSTIFVGNIDHADAC